jgi:hypothetical protein
METLFIISIVLSAGLIIDVILNAREVDPDNEDL